MKNFNSDSTATLSRFAKDKRLRSTRTERVERNERPKRASFNPHFTEDNQLREEFTKGDRPQYGAAPKHSFGSKPATNRKSNDSKPFDKKPFGKKNNGKNFGNNHNEERTFSGKKFQSKGFASKSKGSDKPKSYPKYTPNRPIDEIRLNRFVAQSGLCSRREADEFIAAGLVSVNGVIVTELGTKVKPSDDVRFNDERIKGEKNVYLLLNKPKGYVTTSEDEHADKTVMDLVKGACTERIYPVGRLDKNSLGLLLFTNDGDVTRNLTHPSLKKKKIYEVALDKPLTRADFAALAEGVTLEDGEAYFDEISYLKDDKKSVGVEIHSGRNRIVRRMFEHLGYQVTKLDRVYYAGLTKKNLKRGAWRFLTNDEVNRLKSGRYE